MYFQSSFLITRLIIFRYSRYIWGCFVLRNCHVGVITEKKFALQSLRLILLLMKIYSIGQYKLSLKNEYHFFLEFRIDMYSSVLKFYIFMCPSVFTDCCQYNGIICNFITIWRFC